MKSLLGWFAANPVAANLLMLLIVLGGIASLGQIEQEVFPRLNLNRILVTAEYPGASPVEVEQAVCIPIENALHDLEGAHRLDTAIEDDDCTVKVLVRAGYALEGVMNAVRARTQSLPRLPRAVEPIRVEEDRGDSDDGVIWMALYGPTDTLSLKRLGERIRSDLARLPGVEQAIDYGDLREEIAIQVSAVKLQQYGLTLADIAEAVRRTSIDLPGGAVKAPAGELVVRVEGQVRHAEAFADLILTTRADGMRVRLGEIATIVDGLQERWFEWHHDGQPGVGWSIHAKRNTVAVAREVKRYVEEQAPQLPKEIRLVTWWDDSQAFDERVRTLLEDGALGFALVFLVLALFLRTRVAFWAGVGILTSVLGAFWLMPLLNIPLNMFSLFGFLLAMGILVDDAIIVGESIHVRQAHGQPSPTFATHHPI
jgi:multidrug efflux pump subunit AcrB